jgi:hypothetical protein
MTTADPSGRPFAEEAQSHRAPTPFKVGVVPSIGFYRGRSG